MDLVTSVEHRSDRTVIQYYLRQPYGFEDMKGAIEVFHSSVRTLGSPPPLAAPWAEWYEEVNVPAVGATLVFVCESMRSGGGPPEEAIEGPFLKLPSPQPPAGT